MTTKEFVLAMWPYWLLGLTMFLAVKRSKHSDLLRVESKPVIKFTLTMLVISILRIYLIKASLNNGINTETLEAINGLPLLPTLFVGWEDMAHSLPLVLLARFLPNKIWSKVVVALTTLMVMVSFGLGHTYQGYGAAAFLSLYIPFGVMFGKKRGFGTLMINHTVYDVITILSLKAVMGGLL